MENNKQQDNNMQGNRGTRANQVRLIAGPCVIESAELLDTVAQTLVDINRRLGTDIIFKASFDKANRTSLRSFRGPGIDKGLQMLADVKANYGLKLTTDIHEAWQAEPAGQVVDILQIPAFLCRQTDLLVAAAKTGKVVNIKKALYAGAAPKPFVPAMLLITASCSLRPGCAAA